MDPAIRWEQVRAILNTAKDSPDSEEDRYDKHPEDMRERILYHSFRFYLPSTFNCVSGKI